jgi:hypothetical protein
MATPNRLFDVTRIQSPLDEAHARVFRPGEALDLHRVSLGGALVD